MTTQATATTARREFCAAFTSLANAEALHDLLERNPLPHNDYWCDAVRRADELSTEMYNNLDDVMSRYTSEECGL